MKPKETTIEERFSKKFDKKLTAMMNGKTQWGISAEICQLIKEENQELLYSQIVEIR